MLQTVNGARKRLDAVAETTTHSTEREACREFRTWLGQSHHDLIELPHLKAAHWGQLIWDHLHDARIPVLVKLVRVGILLRVLGVPRYLNSMHLGVASSR